MTKVFDQFDRNTNVDIVYVIFFHQLQFGVKLTNSGQYVSVIKFIFPPHGIEIPIIRFVIQLRKFDSPKIL